MLHFLHIQGQGKIRSSLKMSKVQNYHETLHGFLLFVIGKNNIMKLYIVHPFSNFKPQRLNCYFLPKIVVIIDYQAFPMSCS